MIQRIIRIIGIFFITFVFIGCAGAKNASIAESQLRAGNIPETSSELPPLHLKVGITPDYPPIIFTQGKKIVGIEADMARMLRDELKRPLEFVVLRWDEQIQALMSGKIDIIMSGMSRTRARELRIAFTDPYTKSGLLAAIRAEDSRTHRSKRSILGNVNKVGAVKNTTGDVFIKRNFEKTVMKKLYPNAQAGIAALKRKVIDTFIHDAPAIIWLRSENEADISAIWEPLNEEYLAWGVRKSDENLRSHLNAILERWKKDGTLQKVLQRWLPSEYCECFK